MARYLAGANPTKVVSAKADAHPKFPKVDARDSERDFNLCQRAEFASIDERLHSKCYGMEPSQRQHISANPWTR